MKPPIILNTTEHTNFKAAFPSNLEALCCVRFNESSGSSSAVERQLPKFFPTTYFNNLTGLGVAANYLKTRKSQISLRVPLRVLVWGLGMHTSRC